MKQLGFSVRTPVISLGLLSALLLFADNAAPGQSTAWHQWGGPNRNFKSDAKGLALSWPDSGPNRLWSHPLGDGYSAIVVDDGRLFTLYRKGQQEVVIALDAATGQTIWEHGYETSLGKDFEELGPEGEGPRATPLVVGNGLFTAGVTGRLLCLNKQTGRVKMVA